MRRLQLLTFSAITLLSTSAFACGPMFNDSLADRVVLSGLAALLPVLGYGALSMVYLGVVSRFQAISFKHGVKYWFGSLLVTYLVGAAGILAAVYAEPTVGETHAIVFAATLPAVALAGYFTRIAKGAKDRFEEMNAV